MNKLKSTMTNLLTALVVIVFLPFIILGLVYVGISLLFTEPFKRRKYRKSAYFTDLGIPYHLGIMHEAGYAFYNEAIQTGADFQLMHRSDDNVDYIIYQNQIYLVPQYMAGDFYGLIYDDAEGKWFVSDDDEDAPLEEEWEAYKEQFDFPDNMGEIKLLLLEEDVLPCYNSETEEEKADRAFELLPDYITVVSSYTDWLQGSAV